VPSDVTSALRAFPARLTAPPSLSPQGNKDRRHLLFIHVNVSWAFDFTLKVNMAPIRRYLRITKYSVLECRIYLDNPALAQSWLLNPRDPILPKVIESVRPLVLPKLREEQERERSKKKSKKRSIKDVVVEGG
jgi:hypothetical protein